MKKENVFILILGLAAVSTIGIEIFLSGETVTKTESALFGILQFVFSLAFAWFLSKESSQENFEKQQRRFAIAAFRRIKEIESQTMHLIARINKSMKGKDDDYLHGLDLAKSIAVSIKETTLSSKLDWADVIGDQIETLEKIENIQGDYHESGPSDSHEGDSETVDTVQYKIEELKKSLSSELKLYAQDRRHRETRKILLEELNSNGQIVLHGFIDRAQKVRPLEKFFIGEELTVRLGDHGDRVATLGAYDKDGQYVGSFLNQYPGSYSEFTRQVCKVLGASEFKVKVTSVDNKYSERGRAKFKVSAESLKCLTNRST